MLYTVRGLKAWIIALFAILVVAVILVLVFHLLLFLLPIAIIILVLSYLFKMLNKVKKEKPKDVINVKYKVKK